MAAQISVVVRARDEAGNIGRCLQLLAAQRVDGPPPQLIVVDGGSRDDTPEVARDHGATVVSMSRHEFSFGRALNLGATRATGSLVVAVSADAFLTGREWLARLSAWFADTQVACASGDRYGPWGEPLDQPVQQGLDLAQRYPAWGYSNGAGAFRADLWRQRPFREDLPGCEDKEWAWHWLSAGYQCVIDPGLVVDHDHTHDPVLSIYRRARREAEGLAMFANGSAGPRLLPEWWSDTRFYGSPWRARGRQSVPSVVAGRSSST